MSDTTPKICRQWDSEYQSTVLKIPDTVAVTPGAMTQDMITSRKELFQVNFGITLIYVLFQVNC